MKVVLDPAAQLRERRLIAKGFVPRRDQLPKDRRPVVGTVLVALDYLCLVTALFKREIGPAHS